MNLRYCSLSQDGDNSVLIVEVLEFLEPVSGGRMHKAVIKNIKDGKLGVCNIASLTELTYDEEIQAIKDNRK